MTAEAITYAEANPIDQVAVLARNSGEVVQLSDGRASVVAGLKNADAGDKLAHQTEGIFTLPKTASIAILDGGRVYWDASASKAHFKAVNDRDFLLGVAVGDSSESDTTVNVNLNQQGRYLVDLARDPFTTAIVLTAGTPALNRRGGAHNIIFSTTNEAQKVDALSVDGFDTAANAIIEGAFRVINDGAGAAVDVSIGVASATHATDADSIAESIFIHLNANDTKLYAESDDGTTEVAATDTTKVYVEGAAVANRKEFWMDMRDPADVQIYIEGVLVLGATVFGVGAAVGPWKLLVHVEKTAAADAYEIDIDWLRARIAEQ